MPAHRTRAMGGRISDLRLNGQPLDAAKKYKVAGWAPVAEEPAAHRSGRWWKRGSSTRRPSPAGVPSYPG